MNNKYLVVDDLAFELHEHPIYIPIPNNIKEEKQLNKFVMKVLKKLMKLDFYNWYHKINDIKIDGYYTRNNNIYPEFST